MASLAEFHQAAGDPAAYGRKIREQGRPVIGYFCSYTPEEIILAAGAHPLRLFSSGQDIALADAHLQSYCCSLVRGALEDALSGRLGFLSGTVFPHTCDSIQRLSDIWRLNTEFGFFADVVLPVKLDTESSRQYLRDVLEKFRRNLADGLGAAITDDGLAGAWSIYEKIRGSLAEIYELRAQDPSLLRGRDAAALVKASMIMDREYLSRRLPEVVEEVRSGAYRWDASGHKRLVMAGGVCDQPEIYGLLEEAGGVVVADDLCTGSRWFAGRGRGEKPMELVASRLMNRPACAAKHQGITARSQALADLAQKSRADGAVILLLKFCDPHLFDYPHLKESLDRLGVPNLLYEIEDQLPSAGQLLTRFETFIQML